MSASLSTIDNNTSDELDLNTDVVPSEEKHEVERVTTTATTITESSVTIGVSVAKILSEGETDDDDDDDDEVRVSSGVNLVGTSAQNSDNEEAEVSVLGDKARQQTEIEVVKVECSTITTESTVDDRIQVVGVEVAVMDNMGVLGTGGEGLGVDDLGGNRSSIEKDGILEDEVMEDFLNGESSKKDEKEETDDAQLAGTDFDQVFYHERMDSQTEEEYRNDGAYVRVDSSSVTQVSEGSQGTGTFASLLNEDDPDCVRITEPVEPLADGNPDSEVQFSEFHASEEEEQKSGKEVVECSRETNELPAEQIAVGGELGVMENGEVMETNDEVSGTIAFDGTEEIQFLEAEAPNGSAGSHPNGDYGLNENNSIQEEMITQVIEDDSDQVDGTGRMDLHPDEENPDEGVTVDSSSHVEVSDTCQTKGAYSSLDSGDKPDSARVTASIEPLVDENVDIEVQASEGCSSEDKENKTGIEFAMTECSMLLNESLVEHNGVTAMKYEGGFKLKDGVSVAEVLHENPLSVDKDKSLEGESMGGIDASFETGNVGHEENTSEQAERYETVVQVAKVTVDSSSLSKIPDGSQGPGTFYFPKGKGDPDSEFVTEVVGTFSDANPDSAVQVVEHHGLEITQVDETVSSQVVEDEKNSHPSGKNPNEDSSSVANVSDESQGTGACASLHIESLVDRNLDTEVQDTEGHALEGGELKTGVEVVKLGVSTVITEALVEQIQVVEGEATVMDEKVVSEAECITSGSDALDGNSTCADENLSLQAEARGESAKSCQSCDVNTSLQDEKQEMIAQVAEMISFQIDGDDRIVSHTNKENPHDDAHVTVGSNSVVEASEGSETTGACVRITESFGTLLEGNLDSELEVTEDHDMEDEERKTEVETVKAGDSMMISVALIEQIQVNGGQVAAVDNEESFKTEDNVLGTDVLDGNPYSQEKTQSLEAEAIRGNTESHPKMNLSREEGTSVLDGNHGMVSQLTEIVHKDEMSNSHSVQDCLKTLNSEDCPTAYSSSPVKVVDGSQSTGFSLEGDLDSDVHSHMSLLHEDQTMASHFFEIDASQVNHTTAAEVATESTGGSSRTDGSQITKSNAFQAAISELSTNECIMDSLVNEFCISSGRGGNQNPGDEVVNETISPSELSHGNGAEHNKMEADLDLSVLDPLDDDARRVSLDGNQELKIDEQVAGFEQPEGMEQQAAKPVGLKSETALEREFVASYCLTPEKEGDFSVSDLVWGKVRSHPWWPGQIFDSSDSSEQAMKYHKNDSYLVAYFGDQTFAWNEASSMKHFRTHFSQMEKQASSEAYRTAIDGALDEVYRRVELGMACSCTPKETCSKVEAQIIDNAGIREGARKRDGVDECFGVSSFQPDNFVQYIKALALYPCGESDRVELLIAQAQLMALNRLKGYLRLPVFHVYKGLAESDVASELSGERKHSEEVVEHAIPISENEEPLSSVEVQLERQESSSRKRKHISEDSSDSSEKERNLSELLTGEKFSSFRDNDDSSHGDEKAVIDSASLISGKKHEVVESFLDDSMVKNRKQRLSPSRDADAEPHTPQSFKVGDCIRRIASQLTGAPPILKSRGERFQENAIKVDRSSEKLDVVDCSPQTHEVSQGRRVIPKEYSYPDEMLSQLCLAARDPMKGYSFLTIIVDFFSEFRNSIILDCKSEKMGLENTVAKKSSNTKLNSVETFDFEDTNDSYWTDRIVQLQGIADEQSLLKTSKDTTQTEKDNTSIKPVSDSDHDVSQNKSSRKNRKRKGESWTWIDDPAGNDSQPENSLQLIPALDSKQQTIDGDRDLLMKKPARKPRRRKVDCIENPTEKDSPLVDRLNPKVPYNWQNLDVNDGKNNVPTALVLNFTEIRSIPSQANLNKIFSRFGPIKVLETEVSKETNSARVVFKRRNDAEVALSSAKAFSIFGPASVSYQLMDSPTPYKPSPYAPTEGGQDLTFIEGNTI